MTRYFLFRLMQIVPTVLGIVSVVFIMLRVLPGDPSLVLAGFRDDAETLQTLRAHLRLDEPLVDQYLSFMGNLARGDLGNSFAQRQPVTKLIAETLPNSLVLAVSAMGIAVGLGIPLGIISALRRNTLWDVLSRLIALIGVSTPVFWLGIQLQIVFGLQLGILPVSGLGFDAHLVLPAATASLGMLALMTRMTRSSLLEVLDQDYVRTAYSKGLRARRVIILHALKNAFLPVLTVWGASFAGLLSGTLLVEVIFSWPGMGRLLVQSISSRDYPMAQGIIIVFALIYAGMNLLIDLIYPVLDPRIQHG